MKKLLTNPYLYAILAILLILSLSLNSFGSSNPGYDELAICLTQKGAIMYGTDWCSHCKIQKETFGNSFRLINFVDCDKNKEECQSAGVQAYPTWIINGKLYTGEKSLIELASLAGCQFHP